MVANTYYLELMSILLNILQTQKLQIMKLVKYKHLFVNLKTDNQKIGKRIKQQNKRKKKNKIKELEDEIKNLKL